MEDRRIGNASIFSRADGIPPPPSKLGDNQVGRWQASLNPLARGEGNQPDHLTTGDVQQLTPIKNFNLLATTGDVQQLSPINNSGVLLPARQRRLQGPCVKQQPPAMAANPRSLSAEWVKERKLQIPEARGKSRISFGGRAVGVSSRRDSGSQQSDSDMSFSSDEQGDASEALCAPHRDLPPNLGDEQARPAASQGAFPGLAPPVLNSGSPVTGGNKHIHRRENKRVREARQQRQPPGSYWTRHEGKFVVPPPPPDLTEFKGSMCPRGLALHHPASPQLLEYATRGCPARTGRPWTPAQMQEAIDQGPHSSARIPEVMTQFRDEAMAKAKVGQCRLVPWDDIKHDPPRQLKISPIAAAPHKSRKYRAILDLSFALRLSDGSVLPAVNDTTTKTAPAGAIDQMGHGLMRIVHAFAEASDDAMIFMAKWDVKDGFWRLDCESGEEWSFSYVLPQEEGKPPVLVVPTSLQMGWIESPPYFCAASETGRDVAQQYAETPIGSLPPHKFLNYSQGSDAYNSLPPTAPSDDLRYLFEVYVDDYISIAIASSRQQLDHFANAMGHGIHDVFPTASDPSDDPMAFKKMERGDCLYDTTKDILGFDFDGVKKTLWLEDAKRELILTALASWCRRATLERGTPFKEYQSIVAKLRHAFFSVPTGKGLLSPFNRLMKRQPPPTTVFFHTNPSLLAAVTECRVLLRASTKLPTRCKELVMAWPDFIGVKDASSYGVGGIIVGELMPCVPTVFRLQWPADITKDINTPENRSGSITNSDLEMAGLLLLFCVMEQVCGPLRERHLGLFSDNSPTVSWVRRMASRRSLVAEQLVRGLALRMKVAGASPLTPFHISGVQNAMTDIPSRSWGSVPDWLCNSHDDLRILFNERFPLPNKASWTVFQVSRGLSTRVISVLRNRHLSMGEWRRLPPPGKNIGPIGPAMSNLWDWTLTYRTNPTNTASSPSPASRLESEPASTATAPKSELDRYLRHFRPLERRFPWPSEPTQQNNTDRTNSPRASNKCSTECVRRIPARRKNCP